MAKTTEAPTSGPSVSVSDPSIVARIAAKRDKWKSQAAAVTAERDAAIKERDAARAELRRLDETPQAKQIAALKQQIRERDHRAVFDRIAGDKGVIKTAMDDLWKLSEYKAETDTIDEEAIGALIDAQKTERAHLFGEAPSVKEEGGEKPITPGPKPVPAASRGGPHNPSKSGVVVTRDQRMDPKFMLNPANKEIIAAAAKEHRFGN